MMKGTPYIYQGEELGLTNTLVSSIEELDDIESINMYHDRIARGFSVESIMESLNAKGRDNARRPIPWTAEANGGFTTGTPWLALNPNYKEINVEAELQNPDSVFHTYRKLIQLRKTIQSLFGAIMNYLRLILMCLHIIARLGKKDG